MTDGNKLSTEPYKGVRDFYPRDMFVQNYIFDTMREVAERYGYEEYDASLLEPTELYEEKSGEEIVKEQTYTFEDRGGRSVTLRPEMTPSVARMVAARRRELAFPLRLYSIPNVFRYERPQRGRLREHWQLNCDLFGIPGIEADVEIITLAYRIMKAFGAEDEQFVIKIGSRIALDKYLGHEELNSEQRRQIFKLLDRKDRIENFEEQVEKAAGKKLDFQLNPEDVEITENVLPFKIVFDPSIVRGLDYYTGTVFEVFDTAPENTRTIFGGGRYDNLMEVFGTEPVPAVGFGMGDVRLRDFLETHNLLPEYTPSTDLYLCVLDKIYAESAQRLAEELRAQGLNVAVDFSYRKVADQIKAADRQDVQFIACVGEDEVQKKLYKVKNLESGEETELEAEKIGDFIWSQDVSE